MHLRRAALTASFAASLVACGGTTAGTSTHGASSGSGSTGHPAITSAGSGSSGSHGSTGSTGTTHGASTGSTSTSTSATSTSGGSTTAAGTTATTSGSSSSGASTAGSTGSTGGGCCTQACPGGCDLGTCQCLPVSTSGGTTGGTSGTGSADAGLCSTQACLIYAETAHTLYHVDPAPPNAITRVCDFGGAIPGDAGINDIAVQGNGTLYGITKTDLYVIDPATCAGTHLANLGPNAGGFNGLTFTAADTLLAADARGHVAIIDTATGTVSDAGAFGGTYGCSGDIVGVGNGVIYATAKDSALPRGSNDILVTLDPSQGYAATPVSATNDLGYPGIFGLGFWGGTLYGFDKSGNTLAIDPVQGTSTLLHNTPGVVFFGAGTTPRAPVVTK